MFGWFIGQGFLELKTKQNKTKSPKNQNFSPSFSFLMDQPLKCITCGCALSLPPCATAMLLCTSLRQSGEEGWLMRSAVAQGATGVLAPCPLGENRYQRYPCVCAGCGRTSTRWHTSWAWVSPTWASRYQAGVCGKTWTDHPLCLNPNLKKKGEGGVWGGGVVEKDLCVLFLAFSVTPWVSKLSSSCFHPILCYL